MITQKFVNSSLANFYENFHFKSPDRVLLVMVFTLGLYLIHWVYSTTKDFERIDENNSPNSLSGIFVLFILPAFWGFFFFMYNLLFYEGGMFFTLFEKLGWIFIIILILEYLYRFCEFYAKITVTNEKVWYYSMFPGFLAFTFLVFEIYYGIPFFFFVLIVIPAMQAQLNSRYKEYNLRVVALHFNTHARRYNGL